jgi:phosphonate transport system ATP-binding protein
VRAGGIRVEGLRKSFGPRRVFDELSLAVEPGEVVALLGPSGSGKTTLFRCLVRLIRAEAGTIDLAGHAMQELEGAALRRARRDAGFVFQQFNLVRRRSAFENALAGRLARQPLWRVLLGAPSREDRNAAHAALDRVGLLEYAEQRVDRLSGGQQQRVALARTLVQESRVILADEPVASLDPPNAELVLSLLRDLARERRLAVLCSLHQPDLARRFADRTARLGETGPLSRPALVR